MGGMVWVVSLADPVSGAMRSPALPWRHQSGVNGLGCEIADPVSGVMRSPALPWWHQSGESGHPMAPVPPPAGNCISIYRSL